MCGLLGHDNYVRYLTRNNKLNNSLIKRRCKLFYDKNTFKGQSYMFYMMWFLLIYVISVLLMAIFCPNGNECDRKVWKWGCMLHYQLFIIMAQQEGCHEINLNFAAVLLRRRSFVTLIRKDINREMWAALMGSFRRKSNLAKQNYSLMK